MMQGDSVDRFLSSEELDALLERARQEKWKRLAIIGSDEDAEWRRHREALLKKRGWKAHAVVRASHVPAERVAGLASLEHLVLPYMLIGNEEAIVLARLRRLVTLDLSRNVIADEGATAIAQLVHLTSLNLHDNLVGDDGADKLARLKRLTSLNLSRNLLQASGVRSLATLRSLVELNLGDNTIEDAGAEAVAGIRGLRSLDLSDALIKDDGAKAIATLNKLVDLNLASNSITDVGVRALAEIAGLASLDLSENLVADAGARALAKLRKLTSLKLGTNSITGAGAVALSRLTSLTALELDNNMIDDDGATTLVLLQGLTSLNLSSNIIGDDGAASLLVLKGLTVLRLDDNSVGYLAALALTKLTKLRVLGLARNKLAKLPEGLQKLSRLTTLDISGNRRLKIPHELAGVTDPARIFAWYFGRVFLPVNKGDSGKADAQRILAVKVMLIGDGGVGKSWLWSRLLGQPLPSGSGEHVPTQSFQWGTLALDVEREGRAHAVAARLFDFGGQPYLFGTHRLFLASRRNVFLIVVNTRKTAAQNRLWHWLGLVRDVHERALLQRALAEHPVSPLEEHRRRTRIQESGAAPQERMTTLERRLAQLRSEQPPPPVLVVPTHDLAPGPCVLDEKTIRTIAARAGLRVQIAPPVDSELSDGSAARHVKSALGAIVRDVSEVWNATYPERVVRPARTLLAGGAASDGFKTPASRAPKTASSRPAPGRRRPALLLQGAISQNVAEFDRRALGEGEPELSRLLRDVLGNLGVLLWIDGRGDDPSSDWLKKWVFAPLAVRDAMYDVLWRAPIMDRNGLARPEWVRDVIRAALAARAAPRGGATARSARAKAVRGISDAVAKLPPSRLSQELDRAIRLYTTDPGKINDAEAEQVETLMKSCGLISETRISGEPDRGAGTGGADLVIPERMSTEPGPRLALDHGRWLRATAELPFLPDDLLPKFIGRHMHRCDRSGARSRSGFVMRPEGADTGVRAAVRAEHEDGGACVVVEIAGPIGDRDAPELRWQLWGELRMLLDRHFLTPMSWIVESPIGHEEMRSLGVVLQASTQKMGQELEAIVLKNAEPQHIDQFFRRGQEVQRQVCRLEAPEEDPVGSGFLVGPGVVMTNRHVVMEIADRQGKTLDDLDWTGVRARFDYYESIDGSPAKTGSKAARLATTPVVSLGEQSGLDFAILKLEEELGNVVIGKGLPERGWLTPSTRKLEAKDPLFVIHHPQGEPTKFSAGSVSGVTDTELKHSATTRKGSSGSPCLAIGWEWIALHRAGVEGVENIAIHASKILEALRPNAAAKKLLQGWAW